MYKKLVQRFSGYAFAHFPELLEPLRGVIVKSNLNMLMEIYVGRMILFAIIGFIGTFIASAILFSFMLPLAPFFLILGIAAFASIGAAILILVLCHSYPFHLISVKKKSIEANLPFAINHMSAIAASGVPPFVMFRLLSGIKEYGEVSKEAQRVVRNTEVFGMDITSAIKNVADRCPSPQFKQFLSGIVSTITTGGDLKRYLDAQAKEALFEYKIKREKYLQTLSTYADVYTAVMIAAPLFFVSVLSILALVGGEVFGLPIPTAIRLGTFFLIPMLNIAFIIFIHVTQPQT